MNTRTISLPLGGEATVRGMRGRDEDLLSNKKKVESGEAISHILANCVVALRGREAIGPEDIDALLSPDRLAILLAVRQESYGDEVEAALECVHERCRKSFAVTVDLTAVEMKPVAEGYDPTDGFAATLSTGEKIRHDFMSGKDERKLIAAYEGDAFLTMSMLARVREVEGVHANGLKKWLQDIPVRTRRALRTELERVECGPEVLRKADCPHCGGEVPFQVHAVPGFFFPA